ncbi:hypothetical protein MMC14_002875 [Varicellaria rhodocarpa]|nr:hypothetical protein [Varicellaria rhodocarpa]
MEEWEEEANIETNIEVDMIIESSVDGLLLRHGMTTVEHDLEGVLVIATEHGEEEETMIGMEEDMTLTKFATSMVRIRDMDMETTIMTLASLPEITEDLDMSRCTTAGEIQEDLQEAEDHQSICMGTGTTVMSLQLLLKFRIGLSFFKESSLHLRIILSSCPSQLEWKGGN